MSRTHRENLKEQIILALDVSERKTLEELTETLKSHVNWVKVGMELFYSQGPEVISFLQKKGFNIFLDLKLHDIPNTVQKAAVVLAKLGVGIFNLHALGGTDMMKRTAETIKNITISEGNNQPKIIGVTVLTSHNEEVLKNELNIDGGMEEEVLHLARLVKDCDLDGVVCSPWEINKVKMECGRDFLAVVPGIRPAWAGPGDQVRFLTPGQAILEGADYLVIGRPILNAPDPVEAIDLIIKDMEQSSPPKK